MRNLCVVVMTGLGVMASVEAVAADVSPVGRGRGTAQVDGGEKPEATSAQQTEATGEAGAQDKAGKGKSPTGGSSSRSVHPKARLRLLPALWRSADAHEKVVDAPAKGTGKAGAGAVSQRKDRGATPKLPVSPQTVDAAGGFDDGGEEGALALDGFPVAGIRDGRAFFRDEADMVRLYVGGRLDVDALGAFGPGVSDSELNPTFRIRRARLSIGGQLIRRWLWTVQVDAAGMSQSNVLPSDGAKWSGAEDAAGQQVAPVRAYVDFKATKRIHFQLGQMNVPFTLDNRTSTMQSTFFERSMMSRAWTTPFVRDVGLRVWGQFPKRVLHYSLGVFGGDGPGKLNADRRAMFASRVVSRPLARGRGPLRGMQVGASFRYAMHNKNGVAYDYPAMATGGGYRFWNSTYVDHVGTGRLVHILPSGASVAAAAELRLPYDRFEVQAEVSYVRNNTREAVDGFQSVYTERYGTMTGASYYVQASYWLLGKPSLLGERGDLDPRPIKFTDEQNRGMAQGLELAARWEQILGRYEGAARTEGGGAGGADGDIRVYAASLAANYWLSQHFRLGVSYTGYAFPGSEPALDDDGMSSLASQRAQAPGNRLPSGADDSTRQGAHSLHEVMARVSVGF